MKTTAKLLAAASALAMPAAAYAGSVTIDQISGFNSTGSPVTGNIDASLSDMLVVLITGEHGFPGNLGGQVNSMTYDGISLTQVVNRDPIASDDQLYGDIWVLDNPGDAHTTGVLSADVATRGNIAAFALSSNDPANPELGVGNSVVGPTGSNSVTFDTKLDSLVLAALNLGGAGNTAGLGGVSADSPLTQVIAQANSSWDGHVVGHADVTAAGANTYSFSGGNLDGAFTYAIEIQAIPEPSAMLVGSAGLGLLAFRRRRRG